MTNHAAFTHLAAALVAENDRRARRAELRRRLRGYLGRAVERVGVLWSALALAGIILSFMPMNVRH